MKYLKVLAGFVFLTTLSGLLFAQSPKLNATRGPNGGLEISWDSYAGSFYQFFSSSNAGGLWLSNGAAIVSTGGMLSVSRPLLPPREFFLLVEYPPLGGAIALTNGTILSNTVAIEFASFASGASVQFVALEDVAEGKTNELAFADMVNAPTNRFYIDTTRLKNGALHRLRLRVVDDFGSLPTSDRIRSRYSEAVSVYAKNPISLNGFDGTTGWKFRLLFTPLATNGTYRASASNDTGTAFLFWSNALPQAIGGGLPQVAIEDSGAVFDGYAGSRFYFTIEAQSPGMPLLRVSGESTIVNRNRPYEYIVAEDPMVYPTNGSRIRLNSMLASVLSQMNTLGDHFNLATQVREVGPDEWNILDASTWPILEAYLSGDYIIPPSHAYFFSRGGPVALGERNSSESLRTASFTQNMPSNKLVFAVFDGCNSPYGLASVLVDTKKRSREELFAEGRHPSFALIWERNLLAPLANQTDVTANHSRFIKRFMVRAFETDFFIGRSLYTLRKAFEYARLNDDGSVNPEAQYFNWVGCIDMKTDEITLIDEE